MSKRGKSIAVVVAVLLVTPMAVWASDRFEDVPDSNVFHDDISWLADSGVTFGCNPPENSRFCPSDNVTREQMAAFMRRLSEGQVVDAATSVEADNAETADDADMLDGKDGVAYETRVVADYCQFATSAPCPPLSGDQNNPTVLLRIDLEAPQPGAMIIDTHLQTAGDHLSWLTVDNDCGPFLDSGGTEFIPNGVPGTASADIFPGADAGSPSAAVAVETGPHSVRLCAASTPPDIPGATLTASWVQSSGGIPPEIGTMSESPIPQDLVDAVEETFGDY